MIMAEVHPDKFRWFIDQEIKEMGTWLDKKVTYQELEIIELNEGCDSGGCTA